MLTEFLFNVWHRHEIDVIEKHVGSIGIFQGNVSQCICWVIHLQQLVKPYRLVVMQEQNMHFLGLICLNIYDKVLYA